MQIHLLNLTIWSQHWNWIRLL